MQHLANRWIPLRTKIILPYLLLALLLAIGAAVIGTRIASDSIQERFLNQLIEAGRLSSEWMVREENRMLATERFLAHAEGIPEAITTRDAEQIRALAYPIAVNYQEEALEILDSQGRALISMHHRPGGNVEDYQFTRGDDFFASLAFVQDILQEQSDSLGDKYAARVQLQRADYLYVAGPIRDADGKLVGVGMVGKTIGTIARQIREATLAQVTLYDSNGVPLATTLLESQPLQTPLAQSVLTNKDREGLVRDYVASDISYTEIAGAWQVRRNSVLGVLGVAFAKNFLVILSENTWLQILVSVLLAFVMVMVIGYFVSNLISRPIVRLGQAALQVANGDLEVRVKPTGNDEVATLTRQFNDMISSLAHGKADLLTAYDSTLEGWVKALDLRDRDTTGHSVRVAELTVELARRMAVSPAQLENIRRGALLHDMGKMAMPDSILLKRGPLSEDEWKIMRQHPLFASQMLNDIPFLRPAVEIPACHHERWDGSGYPRGLAGEEIPISSRIFSVVDAWDSLCSGRPYRSAVPPEQAHEIIKTGAGSQFDPRIVAAFFEMMGGRLA